MTDMRNDNMPGGVPESPLELSNHMLLLTKERMVLEAKFAKKEAIIK